MATTTTIQAINNAVPDVGLDTPHPEEPTRKLLNAILRDYLQAIESLEDDTVTKSQIVQVFGDSQTAVISQDALTDYLSNLSFLQLADTPYVYAGSIGKFIRVNAAGDGLDFFELGAAAISNSFNDLSDKPDFDSIPQVVSVADFASLPATGDVTKTYLTLDDGKLYYWSGSAYVVFTNDTATWAGIGGNIGDNASLTSALNDKADAEDAALKSTSIYAGTGLTGGGDLSADRTLSANIGTGAGQVMAGDDSRVTDLEDGAYAQIGIDIAPLDQYGLVPPAHLPAQFSGDYDDLTNKPTLFSGDYDDLTNKPTLGTVAPLGVDTDADLAANSDSLIPSQKAVKAYVDNNAGGVTLKPWTPAVDVNNKLDETAYPANKTSNIFEITGTATPLQWDTLGGTVVNGNLVAFDSSGVPFVVDVTATDLSGFATEVWVDSKGFALASDVLTEERWKSFRELTPADDVFTLEKGTYLVIQNSPPQNYPPVDNGTGMTILVVHNDPYYDSYSGKNYAAITLYGREEVWEILMGDFDGYPIWVKTYPIDAPEPEEISAEQVKQLYESNPNTNAFTDANVNKLANAADKTLPINWVVVSTPTFLIEPEHAGKSLWVTVDCVITVSAHSTLPTGFNCEILKADSSLIVSVAVSGSDTIRDSKSIIVSDASVFKSPNAGVIGLVGDVS